MTVIAWDGTTLAADKRATNAGVASTVTKIFKIHGCLIGIAGHLARGMAMKEWFTRGLDPATFPKEEKDDWAAMLVVDQGGQLAKYESSAHPLIFEQQSYAMGSGRDFALMAMHLGLTAEKAVEHTAKLCLECGNGVDLLTLEGHL